MRKTIVATVAVALVMTTGLVGCKTAPKMPWSKTAATTDTETSTLAHSAPALPADIAKEAEGLAAATPAIEMSAPATASTGGSAAPYSAAPAYSATTSTLASNATAPSPTKATTATPYPTTGASPYSTSPPATKSPYAATPPTPQSTLPSSDKVADLGGFVKPYNPNAVPPAKAVAQADPVTPPSTTNDRYGMTAAANTPPVKATAGVPPATTTSLPAQPSGGGRYGNYQPKLPEPPSSVGTPASVNLASTNSALPTQASSVSAYGGSVAPTTSAAAAPPTGDRYATAAAVSPAPSSVTAGAPAAPTSPATAVGTVVAGAPKYRPGGTSSYQATATGQPAVEIASRPKPAERQQVPNVSAPGTTSEPSEAPRYR